MNFFRCLTFQLWYFFHPPWESGIVPPEVENFIRERPPGRALDLGCGSGTSSIALARAGWQVTGVDFANRAILLARHKAKKAGVMVDFFVGNVLHLEGVQGPFDLVLDIGCYHGLGSTERIVYLHNLEHLLVLGGNWLMYGFFKQNTCVGPGLWEDDLEAVNRHLSLTWRRDGTDKKERSSIWVLYQKSDGVD